MKGDGSVGRIFLYCHNSKNIPYEMSSLKKIALKKAEKICLTNLVSRDEKIGNIIRKCLYFEIYSNAWLVLEAHGIDSMLRSIREKRLSINKLFLYN